MPDILVRNIDKDLLERLKTRAEQNNRSLQKELIALLNAFVGEQQLSSDETASKIRDSLRGRVHTDSAKLLRADRRNIR
ncbi:MAG: hypothetical protein R2684_17250 [Pyrinomonadaceae bacterium]